MLLLLLIFSLYFLLFSIVDTQMLSVRHNNDVGTDVMIFAMSAEHVSGIRDHVSNPTSAGGFGVNESHYILPYV